MKSILIHVVSIIKAMKCKFLGLRQWLHVISYLYQNRGNDSFGAIDVIKSIKIFLALKKSSSSQHIKVNSFLEDLTIKILPKESPLRLIRIGPKNDSGYYSIAPLENSILFSGGAGKNIDFEVYFAEHGANIHIFDPTIRVLPVTHPNIIHHKIALSLGDKQFKASWDLDTLLKFIKSETSPHRNKFLKLDIEGYELQLFSQKLFDLSIFEQIIIEIHDLHTLLLDNYLDNFSNLFENLLKNHHVVCINANNNGFLFSVNDRLFPEIIELTLLNSKYFNSQINFSLKDLASSNNLNRQKIDILKLLSAWKAD
jgi:hypothetical protein